MSVKAGQRLMLHDYFMGCVVSSYLVVAGSIYVSEVMGSCSTDLKSGLGGLEGRRLKDGDQLATSSPP